MHITESISRIALIAGIDEAGRGPVLGPMCISCCLFENKDETLLRAAGVADSKSLNPSAREKILSKIISQKKFICTTKVVPASEINQWMGSGKSLNNLEEYYFASSLYEALLQYLGDRLPAGEATPLHKMNVVEQRENVGRNPIPKPLSISVQMDIIGHDPYGCCWRVLHHFIEMTDVREEEALPLSISSKKASGAMLSTRINLSGISLEISLHAEAKADSTYPSVSAASIAAKVTRDRLLSQWTRENNYDVGSGYPSDPKTISFITEYLKKKGQPPSELRVYWRTAERIMKKWCPDFLPSGSQNSKIVCDRKEGNDEKDISVSVSNESERREKSADRDISRKCKNTKISNTVLDMF
ncbi:MAG: hypothetical protein QW728_07620 [Thermoplasmata archaeon]